MSVTKQNRPTRGMVNAKNASLLGLVIQQVGLVLMIRHSRMRKQEGVVPYLASTAVVTAECLKLLLNLSLEWLLAKEKSKRSIYSSCKYRYRELTRRESLKMVVPALLHVIQNNLLFVALSHLSVPVYQVSNQGKILATAVCSRLLMKKSISGMQYVSLAVLTLGVAMAQLSFIEKKTQNENDISSLEQRKLLLGLSAVFISCFTSGFAGVYFEQVLKSKSSKNISVFMRNGQLASWSILISLVPVFTHDFDSVKQDGFFQGYDSVAIGVIVWQAMTGLLDGLVMKHADTILKGFATSVAVVLATAMSLLIWNTHVNGLFVTEGAIMVILAIQMYSKYPPKQTSISTAFSISPGTVGRRKAIISKWLIFTSFAFLFGLFLLSSGHLLFISMNIEEVSHKNVMMPHKIIAQNARRRQKRYKDTANGVVEPENHQAASMIRTKEARSVPTTMVVVSGDADEQPLFAVPPEMDVKAFSILPDEPQPSLRCVGNAGKEHPLDLQEYPDRPKLHCSGPQFTTLKVVALNTTEQLIELDLSACRQNPRWGPTLKEAAKNNWERPMHLPHSGAPGVDWVYTACDDGGKKTNLRVHPYRLPSLPTISKQGDRGAPSVLVIMLESVSQGRFQVNFPLSDALVSSFPNSFRFPHTSVFGKNTVPNVKEIAGSGEQNIFQVARAAGVLTSIWDDYNPDHGLCQHYPFKEYRVCSKLLRNYGSDITKLYHSNPNPGCAHGEFWVNQHLRYISELWSVYPNERKFHIAKAYACHSEKKNREVCQSNDAPLEAFLREFVPANNDTVVILMGDHGFHWSQGKGWFNEYIGGEFEHRHPLLH
eukprot:scaffold678220_cov130-Attheya_sp.AAC.1